MPVSSQPFGKLPDQTPIQLFTLTNANKMVVKITNYGGIVTSIQVPDKNGSIGEVNLGFEKLDDYLKEHPFFGAIIGRYGNRIAKGKFSIEDKEYSLATNSAENHLHGGIKGFDKVVWEATPFENEAFGGVTLRYLSKDGEEGYPGNLNCSVTYMLTSKNELRVDYQATTDKATILNLTNHCYFNLKDGGKTDCLDHYLQIFANSFTPVNKAVIPTGAIKSVKRTPFNFLKPKRIGERIERNNPQLKIGNGYDHNFVLNDNENGGLTKAAKVVEKESGRILEVLTTEPGLQFYTANWLDGSLTGHGNRVYQKRSAFCLETQHFPDSPNQPHFPSTLLQKNATYQSTTIYRFSVKK